MNDLSPIRDYERNRSRYVRLPIVSPLPPDPSPIRLMPLPSPWLAFIGLTLTIWLGQTAAAADEPATLEATAEAAPDEAADESPPETAGKQAETNEPAPTTGKDRTETENASPGAAGQATEAKTSEIGTLEQRPAGTSVRLTPVDGTPYFVEGGKFSREGYSWSRGSANWEDLRLLEVFPGQVYNADRARLLLDVGGDSSQDIAEAKVKLRRGLHRFHVGFIRVGSATPELDVQIRGPALPNWQSIPGAMLYAPKGDGGYKKEWESEGLDDEGYRQPENVRSLKSDFTTRRHGPLRSGAQPTRMADLRSMPLLGFATLESLNAEPTSEQGIAGLASYGLLRVPRDGEYEFRLKTNGIAEFFFGTWVPDLAERTSPLTDDDWEALTTGEGRVVGRLESLDASVLTLNFAKGSTYNREFLPLPLARGFVRELWRNDVRGGRSVDRIAEPLGTDVVYAVGNGKSVRGVPGTIVALRDDRLVFEFEGKERTIALDKVRGLVFGADPLRVAPPGDLSQRATLLGDSQLPCLMADSSIWSPKLRLPGDHVFEASWDEVHSLEVIGGRVVSLTDLEPAREVVRPLFDLPPAITRNETPSGTPLQIGDEMFARGVCMTSRSELWFDLAGRFSTLRGVVGLQSGAEGPCTIRLDGCDSLEGDNRRPLLTIDPADESSREDFDLAVDDVRVVVLVVDFGDGLDAGDIVVWGQPELVRQRKTANAKQAREETSNGAQATAVTRTR